MLSRAWRSGESRLLAFAIVLAVMVLSSIAIFTARLENTLLRQSNSMIGADLVVEAPTPPEALWLEQTTKAGIDYSLTVLFSSMAYAGEAMQLVSVKAVDSAYPLRGQFETSLVPFTVNPEEITATTQTPDKGDVWVDSRILPLLNIELGDRLGIGEREFTVTKVLIREPDSTSFFSLMGGPRVLMNMADLAATEVVQPGSRVTYQALLASESESRLASHRQWIEDNKTPHQRIKDLASAENRVSRTLDTGRQFLLIAAVMTVLLAGVAIAIAARRFAEQNVQAVALLKSLGTPSGRIRRLYTGQFLLLGLLASLVGLFLGELLQSGVAYVIKTQFHVVLLGSGVWPYVLSVGGGILCLIAFALPALWYLPQIPPLRILRKDVPVGQSHIWSQISVAAGAIVLLMTAFSQDIRLALVMTSGVALVAILTFGLAWGGLRLIRTFAINRGGIWRIAFANLHRRQGQSAVMVLVFAIAMMLLLTLTLLRTSLISEWQMQVPPDAPNHFLVNIPQDDVSQVEALLRAQSLAVETIYPMVRGRLIKINKTDPTEEQRKSSNSLHRELNLTWSETLADDNKIVEGQWWQKAKATQKTDLPGVSVEQEDAERIGIKLGDTLTFSIGGIEIESEVVNIRSLDWRSMRPNFFYILEPGSLAQTAPTFITSFHLPADQKAFINRLLREHPSIMVVELDRVITQVQTIINQVSRGVFLVFILTLCGGCLVLFAAVLSSLESRKQEVGLLRAMGASKQIVVRSLCLEFMVLGAIAGALAIIGCETLVFAVQFFILKNPIQAHLLYWVLAPAGGALFITALGYFSCRHLVITPPALVLRETT